jgi:hypothetical protein
LTERLNGEVGNLWTAIADSDKHLDDLRNSADEMTKNLGDLWNRVEFIRKELMYQVKSAATPVAAPEGSAQILSLDKLMKARAAGIRINLGCGHVPLDGYINIDQRELPGVDIVADVGKLPFEACSLREIFSSRVLEHFSQARLRRLLPYWYSLLSPEGVFRAVVPDGEAMIVGVAAGSYPFDQLGEFLFGTQEYGDFPSNLLTPNGLTTLLSETGFENIEVPIKARRNGNCFEFEIRAIRGYSRRSKS